MCSSKAKVTMGIEVTPTPMVARINGRPVLQPTCNRVPSLERRNSIKKVSPKSPPASPPLPTKTSLAPPVSPKSKSPRPPAVKRGNESNGLNSSSEKIFIPKSSIKTPTLERKKSKSFKGSVGNDGGFGNGGGLSSSIEASLSYSSSLITESPGSIAAVRREQMALQQAQRKMRIAHYGRSKSAKFESFVPFDPSTTPSTKTTEEEKRCSFITSNSDPIYIVYHDEEWGVPLHDDKMLFELLVLSVAQVGSDWTSILKKRQDFRNAFSGFDAEIVANFTDKQMVSVSSEYGIDISRVRGVVDNANQILEIKRNFGSFDKYIWGFVNHKPICTQYKFGHKIPVKTSKSESISKDMVRRGFRFVGPTVVHSFMQSAGLTNDHLITCHRHLQCTLLAARHSSTTTERYL
ncbi:putative DNA-3-methyladenine glycosylase [Quillaja saponaria]|uniref:DNA-3-methyladenine glycosylase n=1 Tax=Quillaja saponaria TaxID=32244 RepID=A0AAD7PBE7_QUISA|nr:putative DNA-3-methyladenine glycosylase [Quillaja saponaria]